MFKTLAFVALLAVAAVLAYAATRPATFIVARTTTVHATPETLYPLINDLRQFNTWNPFQRDPNVRGEYGGPAAGPGVTYHFEGNKEVGKGSIRILDAAPDKVTMQLDINAPFEARNQVEFILRPRGAATEVTWAMSGASPFIARLAGLFMDMDRLVGREFEAGLAGLRQRAERS